MNNWQNNIIEIRNNLTGETRLFYTADRENISTENTIKSIVEMKVETNKLASYTITVILVAGDEGGMRQFFKVLDE